MHKDDLPDRVHRLAAQTHHIKDPVILDRAVGRDTTSGRPLFRFVVASAATPNGPAHAMVLDSDGHAVADADAWEAIPATALPMPVLTALPAAPITISPDTNVLTLNPGQVLDEVLTVTVPKNAGPTKVDVYFLADTTGSMGPILSAVKAGANGVLAALGGLPADMAFGVGNYKDFLSGDPYAFQHQVGPTPATAPVTAAIGAWVASGGGDLPEANLFALQSLAQAPGGSIGWRPGSRRIVVWFGDAPGHDAICAAVSGTGGDITEATVKSALAGQGITVLAISTAKPGLDDDPKATATGYNAQCGPPGGTPGQGTRIAAATGGVFVTGINPGNIAATIVSLVTGAVSSIANLKLVPSPTIAPFVTSITPAAGFGPLAGDKEHVLRFEVRFTGIACKPDTQVFSGTIDVVGDGAVATAKKVQITVPPCAVPEFVYPVKFVCGTRAEGCDCSPVAPGTYATEINIHNTTSKEVTVLKRFIPLVLGGAAAGREPRSVGPRAEDRIVLPPHSATMDDCCRIGELLYGATGASPAPLTIGFVELTASADIAVTAVYTSSGAQGGISLAVEQIAYQRR